MHKDFSKMDFFLSAAMSVCLIAYLYSCLAGEPKDQIKELIFYFGVGLGLTAGPKIVGGK